MPKVTVIIPNYNYGRFLDRRISSILNQTYQDFEVIYMDDASTDDSDEAFSRFATDRRIQAIYNETNGGSPFKQWNKGVRLAQGEYIWIAESDDYADSRLLERLVEKLDRYPDVGLVYCLSKRVNEDGNLIPSEDWIGYSDRWKRDFINDGRDECSRYLIFQNKIPNASAAVIRRSVYERAGYADETMRFCGDWMMWARMLRISDVAFVAEPLNYYRTHPESLRFTITRYGAYQEEGYRVARYILDNFDVSSEVKEMVCQTMVGEWVSLALSKRGRLSFSRNRKIYRIARAVDPRLKTRLVKNIAYQLFLKS